MLAARSLGGNSALAPKGVNLLPGSKHVGFTPYVGFLFRYCPYPEPFFWRISPLRIKRRDHDFQDLFRMCFDFIKHA
jgi:hypothetical protein